MLEPDIDGVEISEYRFFLIYLNILFSIYRMIYRAIDACTTVVLCGCREGLQAKYRSRNRDSPIGYVGEYHTAEYNVVMV